MNIMPVRLFMTCSQVNAAPWVGRFVTPLQISSKAWGIIYSCLSVLAQPLAIAEGNVVQKGIDVKRMLP